MNDVDHFFLPRADQDKLVELLDQIPGLIEDLTIAITRQDRIGHNGPRVRSGSDEQPLPYSVNASEAADLLHDTLAAWVRHTCEHRTLTYDGRDDTLNLARWLKRWILALAMSEGADEAPDEIRHAIHNARRTCDRPREKTIDRPEDENLDTVGLTKTELQIMIHERTKRRVTSKDLSNWISRGHITTIAPGYYSLPSAIEYLTKRQEQKSA